MINSVSYINSLRWLLVNHLTNHLIIFDNQATEQCNSNLLGLLHHNCKLLLTQRRGEEREVKGNSGLGQGVGRGPGDGGPQQQRHRTKLIPNNLHLFS